ncbi:MAG: hypothetical protein ACE5FU_13070, partial [Nitrospinota bacterium]
RETSPLCTSCHKDPHFNQFGDSCDSCHTEYEWFPFRFNHNETGLPLRGVHRVIDCEKCHRNREYRNSSVPDNCFGCHEAAFSRASNHVAKAYSRDCLTCHESFVAWFFKHNLSLVCSDCHFDRFQSAPDHLNKSFSTACTDCHRSTTAWVFSHNSVPDNCASCHLNRKPQSHFSKNWSVCEECHNSKSTWRSAHPATSFPLNHRGTNPADCDACHPAENYQNSGGCIECHNSSGAEVHETTINSQCLSCHPFGQED